MKILWSRLNNSNPSLKGRERAPQNKHFWKFLSKNSPWSKSSAEIKKWKRLSNVQCIAYDIWQWTITTRKIGSASEVLYTFIRQI
jgi:hypothetical protein